MFTNILSFIYAYAGLAVNGDCALEVTRRLRIATAKLYQLLAAFGSPGGVKSGKRITRTLSWTEEAVVFDGHNYGAEIPVIPNLLRAWPASVASVPTVALSLAGAPIPSAESGAPVFDAIPVLDAAIISPGADDTVKTVLLLLAVGIIALYLALVVVWHFVGGRWSSEKPVARLDISSVLKASGDVGQWAVPQSLAKIPYIDLNGSLQLSMSREEMQVWCRIVNKICRCRPASRGRSLAASAFQRRKVKMAPQHKIERQHKVKPQSLIDGAFIDVGGSRIISSLVMDAITAALPLTVAHWIAVARVQELGTVNVALNRDNSSLKRKCARRRALLEAERHKIGRLKGRVRSLAAAAAHGRRVNIALERKVEALEDAIVGHFAVRADNRRTIEEQDEQITALSVSLSNAHVAIEELKDEHLKIQAERDEEARTQLDAQHAQIEQLKRVSAEAAERARISHDALRARHVKQLGVAKLVSDALRESNSQQQAALEHANDARALLQSQLDDQVVQTQREKSERTADVTRLLATVTRLSDDRDASRTAYAELEERFKEKEAECEKVHAERRAVTREKLALRQEGLQLRGELRAAEHKTTELEEQAIEQSALLGRLRKGLLKQKECANEELESKDAEIAAAQDAHAQLVAQYRQYRVNSERLLQTFKDESNAAIAQTKDLSSPSPPDLSQRKTPVRGQSQPTTLSASRSLPSDLRRLSTVRDAQARRT